MSDNNANAVQYQGDIKIVIPNKFVACKPFRIKEDKKGVFKSWELQNPLIELEVVFADKENEYVPGASVYIRPSVDPPTWLRDIFTLDNKEIILVPKEQIVGYKYVQMALQPVQHASTWRYQEYYPEFKGFSGSGTGSGVTSTTITW